MARLPVSASLLALVTLSACGGGGGGGTNSAGSQPPPATQPSGSGSAPDGSTGTPPGGSGSTPPANGYAAPVAPPAGSVITPASIQPVRSANDTAEFRRNYVANEFTNALYALDHGWTGQGVTVGVLDDGVNTTLSAFQGQISPLSKDFGYETRGGSTTKRDSLGDAQAEHGTAVAAVIAARADGSGTVGVAPNAKIAVLRASDYNHDTGRETLARDAEVVNYATSAGIKVINRSLASQGFNVNLRNAMTQYRNAGGLLVNAAGNSGGANPIDAVNVDAGNRAGWLFVVALDPDAQAAYTLASYSNKAGNMADRTVTAVGTLVTTNVNGSVVNFSGTSAAAAQVTGLTATILSKWPQLTGVQAGQVVIDTARDIGAPGVDATFGAGLIDAAAALSPVNPTLSNGATQTSVAQSVMALPEVIGSESIQTALSNVTVLDRYGRDYSGSVAGLVVKPEAGRSLWLRRRLAQMAQGGYREAAFGGFSANIAYASYRTGRDGEDVHGQLTSGELGYRFGATAVRLGLNAQDSLQNDIMGLAPFADGILAYAPQAGNSLAVDHDMAAGKLGIAIATGTSGGSRANAATLSFKRGRSTIRASWIEEKGAVMGAESSGALSLGRGARTMLVELHQGFGLAGGWTLEAYGSVGLTRLDIDSASLVTGASALVGTRAGVQASGPALGGVLSFGVAQPLTIESGRARLTYGSGYDLETRSLLYSSTSADLSSAERRVQLTAGYARQSERSSFRIGMMQDMTDGTLRALASLGWRF